MDGERFDSLIKRMTTTRVTRLEALRGLLAGAGLAVTGATVAALEAEAKGHKGKGKGKGKAGQQQGSVKKAGHKKGKGKGKKGNARAHSASCVPDGGYCGDPKNCCSYGYCQAEYDYSSQKYRCGSCPTTTTPEPTTTTAPPTTTTAPPTTTTAPPTTTTAPPTTTTAPPTTTTAPPTTTTAPPTTTTAPPTTTTAPPTTTTAPPTCEQCSPGGYNGVVNGPCRFQLAGYSPSDGYCDGAPAACDTLGEAVGCTGSNRVWALRATTILNVGLSGGCIKLSTKEICGMSADDLRPYVEDHNCPSREACQSPSLEQPTNGITPPDFSQPDRHKKHKKRKGGKKHGKH